MNKRLFTLGLFALCGVLVACGGPTSSSTPTSDGGSSSSTSETSNPPTSSPSNTTTSVADEEDVTTCAEAKQAENGEKVTNLRGVVVASADKYLVLRDETGYVYVFKANNFASPAAIGAYVSVDGTASNYQKVMQVQVTNDSDVTVLTETAPTLDPVTPVAWTATEVDAYAANADDVHYVSMANATLVTSKYDNFTVDGSSVTLAFQYLPSDLKEIVTEENDGRKVNLEGYAVGTKSGRINFVATEIELLASTDPEPDPDPSGEYTVTEGLSIADLASEEFLDSKTPANKIYRISGIWADVSNTTYGNGYLYDPETRDSIYVYGMAATQATMTGDDSVGYTFTNDKSYSTIGLQEGYYVTMVGRLAESYDGSMEFMGYYESHTDGTEYTYGASVTVNDETRGTASLSKTNGIAFGEEVTVTVTPNSGYVVTSVTHNGEGLSANASGVYVFNAEVNNEIVVTFISEAEAAAKLEITPESLGISASYLDGSAEYTYEGEGITLTYKQLYLGKNGSEPVIQTRVKGDSVSAFYNSDGFKNSIKSIEINVASNTESDSASFALSFGTAEITEANGGTETSGEIVGSTYANATYTYEVQGEYNFFRFDRVASGAIYINSIVINFDVAA